MAKTGKFTKLFYTLTLLAFTVAFFIYKQYMFSFLTLVILLVFTKWDYIKKLVAGRGRVEMQVFSEKKKEGK